MAKSTPSTSSPAFKPGCGSGSPLNFRKRFGWEAQRRRLAKRWTQSELAERVGISLKYIGEIERGVANLTSAIIEDLAVALEWDPLGEQDNTMSGMQAMRLFVLEEASVAIERIEGIRRLVGHLKEQSGSDTFPPREGERSPRPNKRQS